MRVLIVNKFLFPKGGAEMYALSLGSIPEAHGHSVQYFGLRNPKNTVGNAVDASSMTWIFNRHQGNLKAPFRIIYNRQARSCIRRVLDDFQPDVVHLNNIQYKLSPEVDRDQSIYRRIIEGIF